MKLNFSWVIPSKLAGSAMPLCTYDSEDIQWLASQGVKVLVSLAHPAGAVVHLCEKAGIRWNLYEIDDFGIPESMDDFSSFVDSIVKSINNGAPCCIHCQAGIGRTGLVLSCVVGRYLSLGKKAAVAMVKRNRAAIETDEQMRFIGDYLGQYEN